jgi:pseudouridine synthase
VTVNGQVVRELGTKVEATRDTLAVDGRVISLSPPAVYIMLNKPAGYVSTTSDPQGRPTVLDLLKDKVAARLYPVGRLDADSEGLLLLTNDGALTQLLTHPRYRLEKEYLVWVEGEVAPAALARLRDGVPLDGKPAPVDDVEVITQGGPAGRDSLLRIVVHEGRKHEIRRLCAAIGHRVYRLQRVRLGRLRLGDLPPGAARPLTREEIAALKTPAAVHGQSFMPDHPSSIRQGQVRKVPPQAGVNTAHRNVRTQGGKTKPRQQRG